jgi:hypothetical protein
MAVLPSEDEKATGRVAAADMREGDMFDDPADIQLIRTTSDDIAVASPRRGTWQPAILAVAVLAVAALLIGFFVWRRQASETRPASAAAAPATQASEPIAQPQAIPLPPLDETDPVVRQLVGALSSNPVVASWLATDGLLMNVVVVTTRIAEGKPPARELKAIGPIEPFQQPRRTRGTMVLDEASYRRYDRYASAVEGLDAAAVGRLYATLKPRIDDAYMRTGYGGTFEDVLTQAITQLLGVPVTEGPIALKPVGIGYGYSDARLEDLSASQKQLLRMGPDNVRKIQSKLREIAPLVTTRSVSSQY